MITGNNDQSLIESAFELGVCDYLNKPFLPVELRARVRSALKTSALVEDLRKQLKFDALTGLPSKANLIERLRDSIARSLINQNCSAIMFIDLDRFKWINDSLGHDCGDDALKEAAKRLRASVRSSDLVENRQSIGTVSRFGGDEFVVLLESIPTAREAELVASRILKVMREPFQIAGCMLYLSASIGIVTCNGQYQSPDDIIRDADIAMYEAKDAGKGCFRFFEPGMRNRAMKRWQVDTDLRQAIEHNHLRLQYQPIVNLKTGLVESVEALVRWNHPDRGTIPPNDFIPMAEETGLIVAIGEWVMRTACTQFAEWQKLDPNGTPNHISINLSRQQLLQPEFSELFRSAILQSGISPSCVHFEITESEMMHDLETCVQEIHALRSMGAKIDLDDFGTGYSSLACLHQLPIDVLKIDRSLISNMASGGQYSKLVDLVLKLLSETQIQVVAEGIETLDQLQKLRQLHCDFGQGYYFSKPIDANKIPEFVNSRRMAHSHVTEIGVLEIPITIPSLFSIPRMQTR
jgi:diguanylate cyclase (GGDEF)-like protein